jgi:hypothetical protein
VEQGPNSVNGTSLPPGVRPPGQGFGLAGLLGRIIAAVVTLALLVVGLMFSLVVFAVALVGGAALFGWLWWKMRRALRQARQDPRFGAPGTGMGAGAPPGSGEVIEGEVIRGEWKDEQGPRG